MNGKPKIRNYNKKLKLIKDEEYIIQLNDKLVNEEENINNGQGKWEE